MEALYYKQISDKEIQCTLCPHECIIRDEKAGLCRVRSHNHGALHADTYGTVSAMQVDPVEKKPLYHFHPSANILSIGTYGCNFRCRCCQNYHISQSAIEISGYSKPVSVQSIVESSLATENNLGVAYTYNEPVVWYEFMMDIAKEIKKAGQKNVVVSNGYILKDPLDHLIQLADAFNIDLKAFDKDVYHRFTGGDLIHVLNTLQTVFENGKHLEITFLVVPGVNDDITRFKKMLGWIKKHLGNEVPLHLSRYFPNYKMNHQATSGSLILEMAEIAQKELCYVYVGNMTAEKFRDTFCPSCRQLLVKRIGYQTTVVNVNEKGECNECNKSIFIV